MGQINASDIIYATVCQHGRQVASIRISGLTTTQQVMAMARSAASGCLGLVRLTLRNGTQGWSRTLSMMLRDRTETAPVQLSLF